jgi:hypothetical protein
MYEEELKEQRLFNEETRSRVKTEQVSEVLIQYRS